MNNWILAWGTRVPHGSCGHNHDYLYWLARGTLYLAQWFVAQWGTEQPATEHSLLRGLTDAQ